MSSGSLIELSALGSMDSAVTQLAGKHRISPWSGVTPASTNFAVDYNISSLQSGAPTGTAAQEVTFRLNRAGDLSHATILQVELPAVTGGYVWGAGYKLIQSAKLVIGGQEIQKMSGRWMELKSEITQAPGSKPTTAVHKFDDINITELEAASKSGSNGNIVLHIPIPFYNSSSSKNALRSVALAYHEIEYKIRLCDFKDIVIGTGISETWGDCKISLITGSVYLDAAERESVARSCVEQVVTMESAYSPVEESAGRHWAGGERTLQLDNIPFNHPTRMLVVAVGRKLRTTQKTAGTADVSGVHADLLATALDISGTVPNAVVKVNPGPTWRSDGRQGSGFLSKNDFDYRLVDATSSALVLQHSLEKIELKLNNHERLSQDIKAGFYNTTTTSMIGYVPRNGIYVVPFSLNVRAEAGGMAIGSLNLSRVDRTSLTLTCPLDAVNSNDHREAYLFSDFYNVISVRNGMCGIRFSS
jgi:hypothetical protein